MQGRAGLARGWRGFTAWTSLPPFSPRRSSSFEPSTAQRIHTGVVLHGAPCVEGDSVSSVGCWRLPAASSWRYRQRGIHFTGGHGTGCAAVSRRRCVIKTRRRHRATWRTAANGSPPPTAVRRQRRSGPPDTLPRVARRTSSRRFVAVRPSFRMMGNPDLRAHFGTVDNALSPQSQVSNQLIDSFDLIDFCASGTLMPLWAQRLLTRHPSPELQAMRGDLHAKWEVAS